MLSAFTDSNLVIPYYRTGQPEGDPHMRRQEQSLVEGKPSVYAPAAGRTSSVPDGPGRPDISMTCKERSVTLYYRSHGMCSDSINQPTGAR